MLAADLQDEVTVGKLLKVKYPEIWSKVFSVKGTVLMITVLEGQWCFISREREERKRSGERLVLVRNSKSLFSALLSNELSRVLSFQFEFETFFFVVCVVMEMKTVERRQVELHTVPAEL